MTIALILLGSNMDGKANLAKAVQKLDDHPYLEVTACSGLYFSPSIGPDSAPDGRPAFYNMAAKVSTALSLDELRKALRKIEAEMGRVRSADKFASRPIDLDIEFFGRGATSAGNGSIPNLEAATHAHVALPLADIAPDWIHPGVELTLREVAQRLTLTEVENIDQ